MFRIALLSFACLLCSAAVFAETPLPPEAYRPVISCEEFLESLGLAAGPFERYLADGPFAGAGTKYPPEFFFDLGIRYYRAGLRHDLVQEDQPEKVHEWRKKTGARPMLLIDPRKSFTLACDWQNVPEDGDFTRLLADLKRYAPGDVAMLEAPNELNNKFPPQELNLKYKGLIDEAAGALYQRDLAAAMKADPATAAIPLVNYTAIFTDYAEAKPCDAFDFNNMHSYQGADVPSSSLMMNITRANNILPVGATTKPFVPTECGYNVEEDKTNQQGYRGTLRAQAYNIPMLLAEYKRCGIHRTFLFALHNADGYGLLESDQETKRPSWYALKSFVSLFEDAKWNVETMQWDMPTTNPAPLRALPFTIRNAPPTVHTLTLRHSSGDFFILIWNEIPNVRDGRDASNPPVNAVLAFDPAYGLQAVGHWRQGDLPDNPYESEASVRAAEFKPQTLPKINAAGEMPLAIASRVVVLRMRPTKLDNRAASSLSTPKLTGIATENRVEISVSDVKNAVVVLLSRDDRLVDSLPVKDGLATFIDDTEWIRPGIGYRYTAVSVDKNGCFSPQAQTVIVTPNRLPDFVITDLRANIDLDKPIEPNTLIRFRGTIKNIGDGASPGPKRMPDQPPSMYDVDVALTVTVSGNAPMWGGDAAADRPYEPGEEREVTITGGSDGGQWRATPGLHVIRAQIDDLNRIVSEKNRFNNIREWTIQVGPTQGGSLSMVSTIAPREFGLTADGTLDWLHVGGWNDHGTTTRKLLKTSTRRRISDVTKLEAEGHIDATIGGPVRVAWTDGEQTPRNDGTNDGIWGNCVGNGVKFTVPADKKPRRLRIYAGLLDGGAGKLTAKLSDGSAPELVSTGWSANRNGFLWAAQPGSVSVMYEIVYRSANDDQTLEVTWSLDGEPTRFRSQFRLGAITLSTETEYPRPF